MWICKGKAGIFNCFSICYNKYYGLIIQFNVKLTLQYIAAFNEKQRKLFAEYLLEYK